MYMNPKPNKHKIISFNKTTMSSLGSIAPALKFSSPSKKIKFFTQVPLNYFGLKLLAPSPPKIRGGCYHEMDIKGLHKTF